MDIRFNHHIRQLFPATGFCVVECAISENGEHYFDNLPVIGWAILHPQGDRRPARDKYDPISRDVLELYVWYDGEALSVTDLRETYSECGYFVVPQGRLTEQAKIEMVKDTELRMKSCRIIAAKRKTIIDMYEQGISEGHIALMIEYSREGIHEILETHLSIKSSSERAEADKKAKATALAKLLAEYKDKPGYKDIHIWQAQLKL